MLQISYFVCRNCQCYADCSSTHSDVGRCKTCQAPMVWHHDAQGSLTAWCNCHEWKAGRLAQTQEELFERSQDAICPRCKGEMSLGEAAGTTELPCVVCEHPLKPKWLMRLVGLVLVAGLAFLVYYGSK